MIHRFFFYLLILFFPTQFGYHLWPEWTIVLGRKIDYLSPTIFFTDILIILTIVSYLISQKTIKPPRWFLVLISIAIINIVTSYQPHAAITGWIKIIEYILLFVYIHKTKPPGNRVFFFLSLAVLNSSILAVGQFLLGRSIGGILWFIGERNFSLSTPGIAKSVLCFSSFCHEFLRPYATLPHPNVFAGFLAFYILLGLYYRKILFMVLPLIVLVLTSSRTAWFALVVSIVFMIVFKKKQLQVFTLLIFFFCFSLLLATIPIPSVDYESIDVRVALNQSAIAMIIESPLFGVGAKNFLIKLPEFFTHRAIYFLQPVHNIYLLGLAELGMLGIVGIYTVLHTVRFKKVINPPFILLLLFVGLFDHYLLTLQQGNILLVLGIAYSTI
ncbi:MAG: O-antigen ligase family protein, partial [Patescibacteria group bacterium]|nr:O-antigen ligase family protein [Patescibacteria group bacterium]